MKKFDKTSTRFLYIHPMPNDLSSNRDVLSIAYPELEELVWTADDTHIIIKLLKMSTEWAKSMKNIVIFSESVGANFAVQLKLFLEMHGVTCRLVLLAPILDIKYLKKRTYIPTVIKNQMAKIKYIDDALLLIPMKDHVVEHNLAMTDDIIDSTHRVYIPTGNHSKDQVHKVLPQIRQYLLTIPVNNYNN